MSGKHFNHVHKIPYRSSRALGARPSARASKGILHTNFTLRNVIKNQRSKLIRQLKIIATAEGFFKKNLEIRVQGNLTRLTLFLNP